MQRLPVHGLDPAGGSDGQVPVISGGKFVIGDPAGAGINGSAGRSPRLVPYGVKLRGANIVPQDTSAEPWAVMYANWSTKWVSTVKPQINAAASVGANAIRLIGDVGAVHTGALTIDAYVAAYEQFVDYCANLGLWVYACLSDPLHFQGATKVEALEIMKAQAAMLEDKANVIGIDVCQEIGLVSSIWSGTTEHDLVAYWFDGLRDVTTLPLTCSVLGNNNSSSAQWSTSTTAAFADLVDFYDFHPYYDGMVAADLSPFFAATSKPLIIGEYGADITKPARYSAAATVSGLSQVVGSFAWSIADNTATQQFGLFDSALVERPTLTTIFRTGPDHYGALPESGHIVQDEGSALPARGKLNFIGDGVTAADDAAGDATTVTIAGSALTVQDENGNVGVGVARIDFQGAGVTATAGAGEVVVTIPGASGSSGEVLMQDGVVGPPVPVENEARSDWLYQG